MNIDLIQERKREIVERFGQWTAHNIQLQGDIYTIDKRVVGDEFQLRRVVQIASDVAREPLKNLRVLDLGCLEGLYAIEFARRGAKVVGIEGREANIEKARFSKEVLSLENLELIQDDVCNLSNEKHGHFDVVLCLGILYHLDVPDVFYFLKNIAEVCQRFTIIDTHVSRVGEEFHIHNGTKYFGMRVEEHSPNSTSEERARSLWASLDNAKSFWFTRPSLYNLLAHVGFTSVYECHYPLELHPYESERTTLLAIKGRREKLVSSPLVNVLPIEDWPEKREMDIHASKKSNYAVKNLRRLLPRQIKGMIRRFLP